MLSKSYQDCIITPQEVGFLVQFISGGKVLIKDAHFFEDCENWIDRQLTHLTIEKALGHP
ncbi:hypothetical protein QUA45_03560 [Microcoleus sp. Pol12A5]